MPAITPRSYFPIYPSPCTCYNEYEQLCKKLHIRRENESMNILSKLNSPFMYLICGLIILFVAIVCVIFIIRAWRAGKAIGMDTKKMRTTVVSSATFAVVPSIGILLGVIALSGSLGTPWPWLRLSVIGALHYETTVAEAAAQAIGMKTLSASEMTASGFSTIALLMSFCIMWGMVLSIFFNKKYSNALKGNTKKKKNGKPSKFKGFGDLAMTAMFIGLVSAYIGSYIGDFISGGGKLFSFSGDWVPLGVVVVSGLCMAFFIWLSEKKNVKWVDNFSIAVSMLVGMAAAIGLKQI